MAAARFHFRNAGAQAVEITQVTPSCGCTTATLAKKRYEPGEEGAIEAAYTFGAARGAQRKLIVVRSSDGAAQTLEIRCLIEEAVSVVPALVFWRMGEPADPKAVELKIAKDRPVHVVAVESSNPRVLVDYTPGEAKFDVHPVDTAQKESAQVTVRTDFPPDAPRTYTVYARVK